jgi:hypothetical protein
VPVAERSKRLGEQVDDVLNARLNIGSSRMCCRNRLVRLRPLLQLFGSNE